ncbi:MAG: hypothetical protein IJD78_05240 [Clostridia bacterium]|nr:hypothetical protein [Clostridia bacterium]
MAYIEALENTLSFSGEGNEDLTAAINKLKKDYTQKYTKVLSDTAEKVIEGAWDSAVDISTGGVFSVVQFVTSTGYMLTGADDKAENLEMLTAINLYKRDLNRAYEVKAEQIRSGNYTEEDVREAERLYNLSKATTEREYEIMLELSKDKDDKKKIEKELDEIRSKPSFSL